MAKHIAIEWDSLEVRVLVASSRSNGISVDHAAAFPTPEADSPEEVSEAIGQYLADNAKSLKIPANSDCLIALGRGQVEARVFDVPPVPTDELPIIVEMQAPQQFSQMNEEWTLDFYPQNMDNNLQAASVLAAAVSPDTNADIFGICGPASLTPSRVSLRPMLTAALLCDRYDIPDPVLVVDILADQIELTVVHDYSAPVMRTVQLPATGEYQTSSIISEVKRTLASAAHSASDDIHVEKIILLGDEDESDVLDALYDSLDLEIELLNPFTLTHDGTSPSNTDELHCGRYASLIGLIDVASGDTRPAIDFLNPRKAPAPPSVAEKHGRTAILSAAAILLLIVSLYIPIRNRSSQLETLKGEIENGKALLDRQDKFVKKDAVIQKYQGKTKNWLDQLVYLCQTFPNSDDAIVADFRANTEARAFDPNDKSKTPLWSIAMDVAVRDYAVLQTLEDSVRNNTHTIQSSGLSKTNEAVRYPWITREVIRIIPEALVSSEETSQSTDATAPAESNESADAETTVSTESNASSASDVEATSTNESDESTTSDTESSDDSDSAATDTTETT